MIYLPSHVHVAKLPYRRRSSFFIGGGVAVVRDSTEKVVDPPAIELGLIALSPITSFPIAVNQQ
jgi:hypothetical protein